MNNNLDIRARQLVDGATGTTLSFLVERVKTHIYEFGGRLFVAANSGASFEIVVYNNAVNRQMFVVGVDGRDVQENIPASIRNDGLVIPSNRTYSFKGYRLNQQEVLPFKVTTSWNTTELETTGSDVNRGVIGVAVYNERVYRPRPQHFSDYQIKGNLESFGGATRGGNAGMSHGSAPQRDEVGTTSFIRDGEPVVWTVFYNTPQRLREMGINVVSDFKDRFNQPDGDNYPSAFPGDMSQTGYNKLRR